MNIYALELSRIPPASLKVLLRLAKALINKELSHDSEAVARTRKELMAYVEQVHGALMARAGVHNPAQIASEVRFDLAVDSLWVQLVRRLEDAMAYAHPGLDMLTQERAELVDLDEARARAERARELHVRLFGATTLRELVKGAFLEQVESTATLLRIIHEQDLGEELAALVGEPLLRTLEHCQAQYEDMVDGRLDRQRSAAHDHRELIRELRHRLIDYVTAVQTLVRRDQPASEDQVIAHLRPILTLRELVSRSGGKIDERELDALELDEAGEGDEELELDGPASDAAE